MARLAPTPTERIDRDRPLRFRWVGRPLTGLAGDTVATALWANGVRVLGRSFEYRRPRGLYDLEGEGASQLLAVDGVPNQSAGTLALRDGMVVTAQNVRGDPRSDALGWIDHFDRWMPAGFYYRLFHRPYAAWPFFQNRMRALAGLGALDTAADRSPAPRNGELYLNAEVAVIGGGPAGLTAALAAARDGVRVCLFERRPVLGGHLDWRVRSVDGAPLYERGRRLARQVSSHPGIRVFRSAPVTGIWGENLVTGFQVGTEPDGFAQRHWECRARTIIVATGALERPLVFEHNDRPGVVQVDTAWRLARTFGVRPGRVAAFSVGDDAGLEAALDLATLGVEVASVADARGDGHDEELVAELRRAGVEFLPGHAACRARGRGRVTGADLAPVDGGPVRRVACDLLVASAGRQPDIGVLSSAGGRFSLSPRTHTFAIEALPPGVFAAGRVTGLADPLDSEASGRLAGLEALSALGHDVASEFMPVRAALSDTAPRAGCSITRVPGIGSGRKAFLDFDEDGTWKNAVQCAARGFDVPELAKRFGNFGLGPGQYRVPGQNLAMAMAELAGTPVEEATVTTIRPPIVPPSLGTLAGPDRHLYKRTPLHEDQAARGGIFRRAGAWKRARYFTDDPMCRAEIRNVRTNVGLLDSSPLGKFRLFGPDALRALQRVYISDMTKTKPGRCKYSAMCNDTGNIIDDGVVVQVGENDYYLTTSSVRAARTVEWFRYHTRFDGWDYNLVNLTDALASINVAGPRARELLARVTGADVSNEAFPYLGYRELEAGDGVVARCLRLGFVGELSFELHVPASSAQYVWDLLWTAGEDLGVRPFGLEAQYCMRAEKGHVIIGAETEQRVTLLDIGMGWLWDRSDTASKKVGAPALRACAEQPGRLKLVGLRVESGDALEDGAIAVHGDDIVGFVCTTRWSDALGYRFAMALVRDDLAKGSTVELYESRAEGARHIAAKVVPPHFYDPEGERLRA